MTLLVDTSVWSLAFRRDARADLAEVGALQGALERGDPVISTGLVLQELPQSSGIAFAAKGSKRERLTRYLHSCASVTT